MSDTYAYELLERIGELEDENKKLAADYDTRMQVIVGLEAENERLRQVIGNAPHAPDCYSNPLGECDCWKREDGEDE